jgi:hypothetical protein
LVWIWIQIEKQYGSGDPDYFNSDPKDWFCDRLARSLRSTLVQLQEKCQQYSRLAQDLQITSDEALDFEFKLRERESYLESEIQVRSQSKSVADPDP